MTQQPVTYLIKQIHCTQEYLNEAQSFEHSEFFPWSQSLADELFERSQYSVTKQSFEVFFMELIIGYLLTYKKL